MAMDPVIQIEQLRKKFCGNLRKSLWYGMQDIGSEIFGLKRQSHALRKEEFWALKDISFSIRQGESVGLIGSNGAGKSTLLRVISGLIKPDQGSVKVKGRVAPLIALGAGFNPVLTGRENIFVNMSILGLTPEQIKSRFDEVVEFSGLEHALDMPVQTYSSGMAARLGFSCAIFTTPDILLIDEVLAVGDLKFRARCYRKLAELKKSETTFIMVSHNPQSILSICDVGMYLKKGVLMGFGTTQSIMQQYEADLANLDLSAIHSGDTLFCKRICFRRKRRFQDM
jgi:lipopolysaccharide transport system ATP-binding protein